MEENMTDETSPKKDDVTKDTADASEAKLNVENEAVEADETVGQS